jgi:hypothetical protein
MTRTLRWMLPVAAVAGVLLAGIGPAAGADRAGTAGQARQASVAAAVSSHLISGTETSISCLTMARCVAVGAGPRGGQVVLLHNGRQARVTVLRYRAALTSVSCPSKAGCWAIGPMTGRQKGVVVGVLLVKIGPTGTVIKTIRVTVPTGNVLTQIWCRSMTACQIQGLNDTGDFPALLFSPWNGKRWRLDSFGFGDEGSGIGGFSCWQTTCVVVGWSYFNSVNEEAFAWPFHNGVAGAINDKGPPSTSLAPGHQTMLEAVSCVSASTCYSVGLSPAGGIAVTITKGVPSATNEPVPFVARAIACVRVTCWAILGNEIVTLRGGVVTGAPLTDHAVSKFAGITAHGNGYLAIGAATKRGESEVVIG